MNRISRTGISIIKINNLCTNIFVKIEF
ncbi:hypothetical protein QR98_0059630 [Sarcoptes scabiei]|uniref:Uncharacterized protein n=1 Tax=Sarcoptes scabiei TaxID=52283 RepID=A0A132A9C5_SARSC|nr:hypothetical protein QR98_0059630 [Sarcoptes scabiei]